MKVNGKKTYFFAGLLICLAAYQLLVLKDESAAMQTFLGALTAAGLRHAIETTGAK